MSAHARVFMLGFRRGCWGAGRVVSVLVLLFIMCVACRQGRAQVLYGSITGAVTDPSGAPIPKAKVVAVNTGTDVARQVVTDSRGVWLISDLQSGTYRVTISAAGFTTVVEDNVSVNANAERRVDAQLQVAQARQTVTVNASANVLQTERADVDTEISSSQVENLPLGTNRNFQTLFMLVPGSSTPQLSHSYAANPTEGMAVNVNGGSDTSNSTLIDGTVDANFWELDVIAYVPPAEAIQSVNVVTADFNAEQGQAGGAVTDVLIKSGTNTLHGAAWEYNTDSALQARNFFFYGPTNPKDVGNQFGLDLGGPIVKNKLFFFGDWERFRSSQDVSDLESVPTVALRNGDFAGSGTTIYNPNTGNSNGTGRSPFANDEILASLFSSAAQKMTAVIPMPNFGSGVSDNYFSAGDLRFDRDSVDLKINYNPSDQSSLFAHYSAEPTFVSDPQVLGPAGGPALGPTSAPGNAPGLTQNVALGGTYTFTPHLLFDGNVGFTRQALLSEATDINENYGLSVLGIPGTNGTNSLQGGYPVFNVHDFTSLGNSTDYSPFDFRDNEYISAANLSWVKGSHSFRFGATIGHYDLNHFQAFTSGYGVRGGFSFTGGLTALSGGPAPNAYNGWADFLLGLPQSMGKDYQYINPATGRENTYAFYAQDQWQATRKLSINYGLRYEFYPFPTEADFGGTNYDPTTNLVYLGGVNGVPSNAYVDVGDGQLDPRFGIAYRLNENTVARGGFGISSDPEPFTYMISTYPDDIAQEISGVNSYSAAGSLATGLPAVSGPDLSLGKFPLPTYVGTDAYQGDYHRGYTESYNFTLQRALGKGFDAQAAYVGTNTIRAAAFDDINAAGPGGGNQGTPFYQLYGNANSIDEIGPLAGGTYNALQTRLTRRVAGSLLGFLYTYSKAMDYVDEENNTLTWSWAPMLSRNLADAGYDITHDFEAYAVYNLPFGAGQHWLRHGLGAAILGGWRVSPLWSWESGTPFGVSSSGTSLNAPGNSQTANQVLSHVAILGGHGANQPYFNPNAFAPVTAVQFGNTGRNLLRGPGLFNIDASLVRQFNLTERFKLEFRTEAYGLTNTPQFGNPGTDVSSASFANGTVSSYNGYDIITSAEGNRQVRFALTLRF